MKFSDDEIFLNFSYLTSVFYNFVVISGKNLKKVNLTQNEQNIIDEFENLNQDNLLNFIDYKSFLQRNDEQAKKYKLEFIKSAFKLDYNENEKTKLFSELSQKMTISMFSEKNKLIKLLSLQSIYFIFEIYQLFYIIIKKMEECQNKKIQNLIVDNLLVEEKIKQENEKLEKNLVDKNKELKNTIESMKNSIKENKNKATKLDRENNEFKNNIAKLNQNIKELNQNLKEFEKKERKR